MTTSTIRLFVHVLAATVWVGGQVTLAGLVPGLRSLAPEAPRSVARRFNVIAWPAFGVLVVTGIWNIVEIDPQWDSSYGTTLIVKIVGVAASGITAFVHTRARSRLNLEPRPLRVLPASWLSATERRARRAAVRAWGGLARRQSMYGAEFSQAYGLVGDSEVQDVEVIEAEPEGQIASRRGRRA